MRKSVAQSLSFPPLLQSPLPHYIPQQDLSTCSVFRFTSLLQVWEIYKLLYSNTRVLHHTYLFINFLTRGFL
ncbi:hypothetical protein L3X38_030986 [Prunus dulcis]|uniref:Uncharacterized protein n=1 Tax=Prunus dulcis TaxID=3755 RepID=A0AAD4VB84_PRUDU|nr:hypothetical protein L3X38_030986 [Prunus dulcis]